MGAHTFQPFENMSANVHEREMWQSELQGGEVPVVGGFGHLHAKIRHTVARRS